MAPWWGDLAEVSTFVILRCDKSRPLTPSEPLLRLLPLHARKSVLVRGCEDEREIDTF